MAKLEIQHGLLTVLAEEEKMIFLLWRKRKRRWVFVRQCLHKKKAGGAVARSRADVQNIDSGWCGGTQNDEASLRENGERQINYSSELLLVCSCMCTLFCFKLKLFLNVLCIITISTTTTVSLGGSNGFYGERRQETPRCNK